MRKKIENEKSKPTERKVTAGRITPTPTNELKPKVITKPKDK